MVTLNSGTGMARSKISRVRRVFNWFKPAFIHMRRSGPVLLVLGLAALIILLWWLGPKWEIAGNYPLESLMARVLATTGIAFILVFIILLRMRKRLNKLNAEREKEERDKKDPASPFLDAMEARYDYTLNEMRASVMSRNFIYALPWYIVIGAEDSGKTSFINRSNQSYTQTNYSKLKWSDGVELPYKIDWWIGNDAVIIDPDGELISEQPKEEFKNYPDLPKRIWEHFLNWLEQTRIRRPLNGALLIIDLPAILEMRVSDRKAYAILLRKCLRDLIEKLGTRLPVYIVLTKFDLVDGFDAFFRNLNRVTREKTFGFTFSMESLRHPDRWLDELAQYYDDFLKNLNESVFDALADAPNQSMRNELFSFSRQLAGVKDTLIEFLTEILQSDRFSTPALVRGVYFTSVYQQGIASNTFVQAAASSFSLPSRIASAKSIQRSVTYFSKSLFQDIIYPEAGLAGDNMRVMRNKKRIFLFASVIALVALIFVISGWQYHYRKNIEASEIVLNESKAFTKIQMDDRIDVTGNNLLKPLNHIRTATSVYGQYRDKLPLVADMGLYQGWAIGPKVEQTYLNLLSMKFLPELAAGVIDRINATEPGSNARLAALRVLRMIEDKSNRRKEIVTNWMAREWHKYFKGEGERQEQLLSHLDYAMDFVEAKLPQYDGLVKEVQNDLRQISISQRVYQAIKDDAQIHLHNTVDLRQRIGPDFDLIYENEGDKRHLKDGDFIVDALFTSPQYRGYFIERNKNVIDLAIIDQWVLGERDNIRYSEEDERQLSDDIRTHYINDYIDTWKHTLAHLEVKDFGDIEYGVKVLEKFTGPTAPIQRLILAVEQNAEIYPPLEIEDDKARAEAEKKMLADPDRREAVRILRNFKPMIQLLERGDGEQTYYEELIQTLTATYNYLASVQNSPDPGKIALKLAGDRFKLDGADPIYALQRVAMGLPEPLSAQIGKVASESWKVLLIKALRELEKKWDEEIYQFFQEKLAGRYPFDPKSKIDASLEDFEQMFGPKGRLPEFYKKYLKVFLYDNFNTLYSEEEEDYLVRTDILEQLNAAWRIQDGFFDSRGALNVNFGLQPLALSANKRRSIIDIDGQLVSYSHGPQINTQLIWPNTLREGAQSKLSLVGNSGASSVLRYRGPWSWFRLLDRARVNGASENTLDVTFGLGKGTMRYRVHSEKSNSPLLHKLFAGFDLPRTLLRERPANTQPLLLEQKSAEARRSKVQRERSP